MADDWCVSKEIGSEQIPNSAIAALGRLPGAVCGTLQVT